MYNQDFVEEFMEATGQKIRSYPGLVTDENTKKMRWDILMEEIGELYDAIKKGDIVAIADALGDIEYVLCGTASAYGISLNAIVAEIHRSNMTKVGKDGKVSYREDGKVSKGPDYQPPDIEAVLESLKENVGVYVADESSGQMFVSGIRDEDMASRVAAAFMGIDCLIRKKTDPWDFVASDSEYFPSQALEPTKDGLRFTDGEGGYWLITPRDKRG